MAFFRQLFHALPPPAMLLTLAGVFYAGCSEPPPPPEMPTPEVTAATPLKVELVEWDEFVGRLEPVDFVEVRARVSGYLISTHFREGQIVNEGDLLCIIDPRPYEAEVRRAQSEVRRANSQVKQANAAVVQAEAEVAVATARHELAVKQLERSRKLVQQDAVSQDDFDIRESEVSQSAANLQAAQARLELARTQVTSANAMVGSAETALALAELNLSYTQVKAPVTGRVSSRHVTEGNLISGGAAESTLITTIVSLDPIYCYFDADERSYLKYVRLAKEGHLGDSREVRHPVYVGLADEAGQYPHLGHMDFVDNQLDRDTGTMRCRAVLPNPDYSLTPGLFARLRIPGSPKHEVILIPDLAVGTDQSEKFVLVAEPDGTVNRRVVTLGGRVRGLRIIRTGLDGSERIVYRGMQRARPGTKVVVNSGVFEMQEDGLPLESTPFPEEKSLSRQPEVVRKTEDGRSSSAN
jgi:RND family efflux transporter MFP subunit